MNTQVHSLPGFFEPFDAMTHLLGTAAFGVFTFFLLRQARGDGRRVLAFSVFAGTTLLLLSMSGVFHMLEEGSTARGVLGRLDKAAIFALIAGTHTPVQSLFFRGVARWGVLIAIWLLAATGITLFSVFYDTLPAGLATGVYLLMGWIAGLAGLIAWRRGGAVRMELLILGGVVYSVGAILMGLDWPTLWPAVIGPHGLWHIAVLTALSMHWRFFFLNAQAPMDGALRSRDDD